MTTPVSPPRPERAPSHRPAARLPSLAMTRDMLIKGLEVDDGFVARIKGHDIARFHVGNRRYVSLAHPDYVDHVLYGAQPNYGRSIEYELMKLGVGISLLTDEGESWRHHRALLTPMFAKRRLDDLIDLMTEPIAEAAARVATTPADAACDVNALMVSMTMEVLGRSLFGRTFEDLGSSAEAIADGIRAVERLEHLALVYAPPRPLWRVADRWINGPVPVPPPALALQKIIRDTEQYIWDMVAERRAQPTETPDLLNLLLQVTDEDGAPLSDKRIRDEVATFIVAGHETTANALSWMWWQLSEHPEAYDRMLAEVDDVLEGRTPTIADLPRLPWTQACFEESMRRYPAVWIIPRTAREDDMIGGHRISAGTNIMIPVRQIHHDPRWWPDPERYDPERFLPGADDGDRPRCAYLPFGGGRRVCIGRSFALMEAVLITAMLAQRVRFELVPGADVRPESTFTLRPRDGVPMRVRPRTGAAA